MRISGYFEDEGLIIVCGQNKKVLGLSVLMEEPR
jgi:hypothetical protein